MHGHGRKPLDLWGGGVVPFAVLVSHYLGAHGLNVNMVWQIKFWYKLQQLPNSLIYMIKVIEINF